MISKTQFRNRLGVALLLVAILGTACGAVPAEPTLTPTPIPTPIPTSTPEPTPTTVPTPGPGPAFETDKVMEIPGMAKPVGQGTCKFEQADEAGMILITINGTMPVENGETCWCCVDKIFIDPNVRAPISMFEPKKQPGVSMTVDNMQLKGPMPEETDSYILSGPEGAQLQKEGAGLRLVSGLAFYVEK